MAYLAPSEQHRTHRAELVPPHSQDDVGNQREEEHFDDDAILELTRLDANKTATTRRLRLSFRFMTGDTVTMVHRLGDTWRTIRQCNPDLEPPVEPTTP